ncbi:hypothetical protein LPJ79_001617 [Coemansia sp. RSA 1821]|nr:hypothetical protein BX667DRAFT_501427 [Coemansia mojavensis]KAJ1743400.1 hypothetical protein LPJ68_001002 [Coemansia sp. RSA 1086]KAJ1751990.1 hypothetical protein LPJ79_001617 [Coemansia sp. RSA 1821]
MPELREALDRNLRRVVQKPPQNGQGETTLRSRTSSSTNLDDIFPEDPAVIHASQRIRRIIYRKREQEIARWPRLRRNLHIIFYEPSSLRARLYMGFSVLVLLLFLIVFMIDTFPQYRMQQRWRHISRLVNLTTAAFFAAEWVLRFYSFRRPTRFLFQPLSIVDVIGIVPGFITYSSSDVPYYGSVKWLRALQVLRILRVLRLTEYSVELYVTLRTLRKSLSQILVVMTAIIVVLLTACFLLFYAETDGLDEANVEWLRKKHGVTEVSPFQNVFFCLYWGFVTITTVGYGDYTPASPWGQVIACITMFMGVFTIVFPTSIISNNFASEWEAFRKAQKIHEHRILQRENQKKRQELARLWSDANQLFDRNNSTMSGNEEEDVEYMSPVRSSYGNTVESNQEKHGSAPSIVGERRRPNKQASYSRAASAPNDSASSMEIPNIGPVEYSQLINISKKVEQDLGIPGITLGDINNDSEVNQNLVVSAMYSRLYNDAYTSLCERLILRLVENHGFSTIEQVVDFIEYHPGSESTVKSRQQEAKLSVLEYKLLNYVFSNLHGRLRADKEHEFPNVAPKDYAQPAQHSQNARHGHRFKRRFKSRLHRVTDRLALSNEPTKSVHEYMTSTISSDKRHRQRNISSGDLVSRAYFNAHRSSTTPQLQKSQSELPGSDNEQSDSSESQIHLQPTKSPELEIAVPSDTTSNNKDQ